MAETPSVMIPLGTKAPDFTLPDTVSNKLLSLHDLQSDIGTVIFFICNHCPYVKNIQKQLVLIANQYQAKGFSFIAISSNDVTTYPEDAPALMQKEATEHRYPFPYLYDETQAVARAYHAACTPDFYLFDAHLKCVYRGRLDDSTPGNHRPVTGKDLCDAMDCLLSGTPIATQQLPSVGCNIKWKKDVEKSFL